MSEKLSHGSRERGRGYEAGASKPPDRHAFKTPPRAEAASEKRAEDATRRQIEKLGTHAGSESHSQPSKPKAQGGWFKSIFTWMNRKFPLLARLDRSYLKLLKFLGIRG